MTEGQRVHVIAGTIGVLIVAALLLATAVDAAAQGQRGGRGAGRPGGPGGQGFIGGPGGPGGGLFRLDSLTDAQRQQIRTLTEQRREELGTLFRQVAEARRALTTAAQAGQVDEAKAADLGAATSALALARARLQADVFGVLTADQKAELARRREQMRAWLDARPGGAERGRRGGGPGRRGGQPL